MWKKLIDIPIGDRQATRLILTKKGKPDKPIQFIYPQNKREKLSENSKACQYSYVIMWCIYVAIYVYGIRILIMCLLFCTDTYLLYIIYILL